MFDHMIGACWVRVSPLARDLVNKLLEIDQEKRLTAEQILNHQWFQGDMVVVERAKEIMGLKGVIDSVADSGVGSLPLTVDSEDELGDKRGEKRKTEDLMSKAREKRKTYGEV